jgi:anaerobic selenocysteine-containing dehydrogenase
MERDSAVQLCGICHNACPIIVEVEGGRAVAIRGERASPLHRGYLCPKGMSLPALHDDPRRSQPRRRNSSRRRGGRSNRHLLCDGETEACVSIHAGLRPGLVSISHGFGGLSGDGVELDLPGASTGLLIDVDHDYDSFTGQPRMSDVPVGVRPLAHR